MWGLVASIGGGVLYALPFPPLRWRGVAWIALVPLLVAVRLAGARRALGLAALFAIVGTCATVHWLPRTVALYYGRSAWIGIGLFVAVMLLMVVPPVAAFGVAARAAGGAPASARPLLVAASWVTAELWRAHVLGGNPWVLLGYSQVGVRPVVQLADVAGVFGLSFVVATVNAAIAELVLAALGRSPRTAALRAGAVASLVVASALVYGGVALRRAAVDEEPTRTVGVVQGALDLGSQWQPEFYGRNLDVYLRLSLDLLRREHPAVLVWPEAAMTFFLESEPLYRRSLASVLAAFDATLVAGGPSVAGEPERYYNAVFAVAPSGEVQARYDKQRLLPFAEYFPFSLDLLRRSFGRVRAFVPGGDATLLPTPIGPAGVLVCNEALYPDLARARVRDGAALLLALTNDTWVDDRTFAGIAAEMAILRAVETRRYLVRASTAGPSFVVTPTGTVVGATPYGVSATTAAPVAARRGPTLYVRIGDAFALGCAVVTLAWALAGVMRRGRARGAG